MWLTVREYADKVGKTRATIYFQLKNNKIDPKRIKRAIQTKEIIYIYEPDTKEDTGKVE